MATRSGGNRLLREKSPYLLQHGRQPVDWYPWEEEAFARARAEGKPVFLSIGYSTCHWCHVMAHESFDDPEVAALLNQTFVCVKVDREERPDVDLAYMEACHRLTGACGWPLTICMTPTGKPFFAATYLPRESRFGRLGMLELIPRVRDIWRERRRELERLDDPWSAPEESSADDGTDPGEDILQDAYHALARMFDERHGGFGGAPKFPQAQRLVFLLRYGRHPGREKARDMAERTLQALRGGGIFDQIGFGFHRYATDERWQVPHFEKMLYDQALLARAYLEAFQITGSSWYGETAREIFAYVLRDLEAPTGGFCTAEDADSDGEEGKYYLWTVDQLRQALTPEELQWFQSRFGCRREGNFPEGTTDKGEERNILYLHMRPRDPADLDATFASLYAPAERERWRAVRGKLLALRETRPRPQRDDKILTDGNGLMIAALARGAVILGEFAYAVAASRALDFILATLRDAKGSLKHRYREGEAAIPALLDDYAFLIWGLRETYEVTGHSIYLETALSLQADQDRLLWDEDRGGYYFCSVVLESPFPRPKTFYDGAIPSGNAVAALNLLHLFRMTGREELRDRAGSIFRACSRLLSHQPAALTQMLIALDERMERKR